MRRSKNDPAQAFCRGPLIAGRRAGSGRGSLKTSIPRRLGGSYTGPLQTTPQSSLRYLHTHRRENGRGVALSAFRRRAALWHFWRSGMRRLEFVLCARLNENSCISPARSLPAEEHSCCEVGDHRRAYVSFAINPDEVSIVPVRNRPENRRWINRYPVNSRTHQFNGRAGTQTGALSIQLGGDIREAGAFCYVETTPRSPAAFHCMTDMRKIVE